MPPRLLFFLIINVNHQERGYKLLVLLNADLLFPHPALPGLIIDPDGGKFPCLDAAIAAAKEDVRHLIAEHIEAGRPIKFDAIEVQDADGIMLASVTVVEVIRELLPNLTER